MACKTGIGYGPFLRMYKQCAISYDIYSHPYTNIQIISKFWFLSGMYLHNWLIPSSTYMKKVNDVTGWLSQTTDISKYFIWSLGLKDKESRLYFGSMSQYDPASDLKIFVGHCDLYCMVHWICLISWRLYDVWTLYFVIMSCCNAAFALKQCRSQWSIFSWSIDFALYLK